MERAAKDLKFMEVARWVHGDFESDWREEI